MKQLRNDCFLHDKERLRHDDALTLLRERIASIAATEEVALGEANGRILAENVVAPRNIPFSDNSAVDGYAYAHADHEPTGGFFPVAARIAAGDLVDIELPGFSAARIFTGAPMPNGADTVVMQEDCELHEQDGSRFVIVPAGLRKGANRRKTGEDVTMQDIVAKTGLRLRPQDIAAIASTGNSTIKTFKPLRIGLISSGNEVMRPGEPFEPTKIYDSNHFMLHALLAAVPTNISDLGICKDNVAAVETLLEKTSRQHDVLVSTGAASRGEEDHFVNAVEKLGICHLWQLAVKPGRPMAFGQIGETPVFILPGNPVAAFVCFLLYVRPALIMLAGGSWSEPNRFPLKADFALKSKPDRREFLRGIIARDDSGQAIASKFGRDGSGLISGLQASSGLIEVREEITSIRQGDTVDFIPFSEFGIPHC